MTLSEVKQPYDEYLYYQDDSDVEECFADESLPCSDEHGFLETFARVLSEFYEYKVDPETELSATVQMQNEESNFAYEFDPGVDIE